MIHRQNYHDVHAYLRHIEREKQNAPETVKRARSHLRHLLEWSDETPLTKARNIDPTFPTYLLTARADGKDKVLAPASIIKCLTNTRQFFEFAHGEWTLRYKAATQSWIDLLQPPRHIRADSRLPIRQYWSLDDVRKIAAVSAATLRQERGKVAVCMLYLSGMRADALASLPISCVDLANNQIMQLPEMGVRTKNRKAALTYLLQIPEIFDVVKRWDQRVRTLPPESLWYATLNNDGMSITSTISAYVGRKDAIEEDVRLICNHTNVPYLSPHKLRHGHVVYALKLAHNMAELKAISQNVMHSSVTITDQIYGNLLTDDVKNIINELGVDGTTASTLDDKISELIALLQR
jgi:site-specific recombinase XerD